MLTISHFYAFSLSNTSHLPLHHLHQLRHQLFYLWALNPIVEEVHIVQEGIIHCLCSSPIEAKKGMNNARPCRSFELASLENAHTPLTISLIISSPHSVSHPPHAPRARPCRSFELASLENGPSLHSNFTLLGSIASIVCHTPLRMFTPYLPSSRHSM